MVSELISASVSGTSSEVVKNKFFTSKLFGRSSDNRVGHCDTSNVIPVKKKYVKWWVCKGELVYMYCYCIETNFKSYYKKSI